MKDLKVKKISELGVALALAVIFNFIRLYQLPQGGSVSLEMLPIFFIALRWGMKEGALLGSAYGVLQLVLGAKIYYPLQAILDYPLAFSVLGLAGLVKYVLPKQNKLLLITLGSLLGGAIRLLIHTISGVVFFGQYAPEGQNVWLYSISYNASYMIPEILITIIVIFVLSKSLFDNPLLQKDNRREVN